MKDKRVVSFSALVYVALFGLGTLALAQQGWSQAARVKYKGGDAVINAVTFDGDDVWIVGANGFIATSFDEGRGFQEMDLNIDAGLNDVFVRKDRVWIVGDAGNILLSTDGGRSFVKSLYKSYRRGGGDPQRSGAQPDLYSVYFTDSEKGFIVGDEGLILFSSNGGVSWREQNSTSDAQLFHLSFRDERGWVVGTGGTILHTYDGGKNWYRQRSGTTNDLNRVYMISDDDGLITGDNGTLLRTENGGATWVRVPLRTNKQLFGISFIDKKTGWIVGENGIIIRTYDRGETWVEQDSGTSADLFSVSFRKNLGFAIGQDGLVMRYFEKR